jgi:hypothetical protein
VVKAWKKPFLPSINHVGIILMAGKLVSIMFTGIVILALSSCFPAWDSENLKFESVTVKDNITVDNLHLNSSLYREHIINPMLRVTISTNEDLFRYLTKHGIQYPVVFPFFCGYPNNRMEGGELAYYQNKEIIPPYFSEDGYLPEYIKFGYRSFVLPHQVSPLDKVKPPYHYQVFIGINQSKTTDDYIKQNPESFAFYNLWKNINDVCFYLEGIQVYSLFYMKSNIVHIPKGAIKAALDDYRKNHPNFVPPSEP